MGDVSKNFNRSEFACSCGCGFNAVDVKLLEWLEIVREEFGPVIIHCACRCLKKNKDVGSKDTSQHIKAKAVDFHISRKSDFDDISQQAYWIDSNICPDTGGLIMYNWGIHLDIRSDKYREDKRQ